jgi:hypothetical protein
VLRKSISETAIEPDPLGGRVRLVENEKMDAAIAKHVGDNMGDGFYWIFVPTLPVFGINPRAGFFQF